jgi:hypothetical protein
MLPPFATSSPATLPITVELLRSTKAAEPCENTPPPPFRREAVRSTVIETVECPLLVNAEIP